VEQTIATQGERPTGLAASDALPRVLHLIGSLDRGGTEGQLVELIRRSAEPARHHVVLFSSRGPLADRLPSPPTLIGPLPRGFRDLTRDLRTARQLREAVRDHRADLVHAHLAESELFAAVSLPLSVPLVVSRRGRTLAYEDRTWYRIIEAIAHRRASVMVCNSEDLAAFTLAHDRFPPGIVVIPNGIDTERFPATPLPTGDPVVTVVANLIAYKRHDLFLMSFAHVLDDHPVCRAVLVGDGPERERLQMLAVDLGIHERVSFAGRVADPRPYLADATVVALTSIHEGTPNALLEAMSSGRPVVATAVGGIPEVVRHGEDGLLVEADPRAIGHGLARLLADRTLAERMARSARARAEDFRWDRVVAHIDDVHARVRSGQRFPRGKRVA
jgi:glycosyltransferase involved in cell wall biosynthesis